MSASLKRKIAGVKVRFYKRTAGGNLAMDFVVDEERFQESTGWPHIADAERVALARIEEIKRTRLSLGTAAVVKGEMATVGDIEQALRAGDKVMDEKTLARYLAALKHLARFVSVTKQGEISDEDVTAVPLDRIIDRAVLERWISVQQGRNGAGVNWRDRAPGNVGINSTLRNAASVFQERLVMSHYKGLRLPPLEPLRKMPALPVPPTHFVPWPVEKIAAMDAAGRALKEADAELWLCHAMLRRLGLRDGELLEARGSWIVWGEAGEAWLDIRPRQPMDGEPGFDCFKHGRPRKLGLDAELQAALRGRTGWLIAPEMKDSRRYDFIYREHCAWLRGFVPEGRTMVNHELRKLAASVVYTQHGLAAAAYFLGDSVATTERHYASWTGEIGRAHV